MRENVYCFLEVLTRDRIFKVKRGTRETFREMLARDSRKTFFLTPSAHTFK